MKEKQVKYMRIALGVAVAALVIAAGSMILTRKQGAPIVAEDGGTSEGLTLYRIEAGGEQARVQAYDSALAETLVHQINLQPATETERFAPEDMSVAYGIRIPREDGDFLAVYCDGQWSTSEGRSWAMALNLERVWELAGVPEEEPRAREEFPMLRALATAGGVWHGAYLDPTAFSGEDEEGAEEILLSVEELDLETGQARLILTNKGRFTHSVSMRKFALEVSLGGDWYRVPPADGKTAQQPDAGYDVTVHLPITLRMDLSGYLPLPAGEYRLVNTAENIYSVTPRVTVAAGFTVE